MDQANPLSHGIAARPRVALPEGGGDPAADVSWRAGAPLPANRPRRLPDLIASCLERFPNAPVLCDRGTQATWRELDAWSGTLAGVLASALPTAGRLVIMLPNGLPHLLAELAAWRLAALAVPIFAGFGAARIAGLIHALEPAVVVADDPALMALAPRTARILSSADVLAKAQGGGAPAMRPVHADTPCLVQFTSGSTGTPRGVVLTHDNLCSQQAAFALLWPEIGPGDRLASYLPWHHSFGGLAERLWALCRGALLTVVPGGGRERGVLLDTIRAVRPTVFMSVPKVHALAAAERLFAPGDLRWAFTAGAPLPAELDRWYAERGIPVYEGWGLTETSPSCTITPPGARRRPGVVGQPIPGVEVGVRRGDGRILVRGPNVMAGYFRCATPCLADGVLDSGDLGRWTEDGLLLTGRADHQLKLGNGEKVSAAHLEAELHAQPGVLHAVVASEPELIAVIEPAAGAGMEEALRAVLAVNAAQPIPYQRMTAAYLAAAPMTVENGQLTASLKVSRGTVLDRWRAWRARGGVEFSVVPLR
jgi:long-subunit acyl-CoA synthetase (AMP-forming)